MDLPRSVEHGKTAFRMAGLNQAGEAAPELLGNIGGAETDVLDNSSTKSGFSLSETERTAATVPLAIQLWKTAMNRLVLSALLLSFSVFPARSAQQEKPQETNATLSECYAKVQELEEWAGRNLPNAPLRPLGPGQQVSSGPEPTPEQFAHNIRRIREEESKSQWLWFFRAMGLGAGLIAALTVSKAIRRTWPLIRRTSPTSPTKQQLFVLIVGATWISVATLLAILNSDLSNHPINLIATVSLYSLPAILFGGICFWWIGKCQPSQKTP